MRHVQFDSGTTNVNNNGIYTFLLTNEPTNKPSVELYSRCTFIDN